MKSDTIFLNAIKINNQLDLYFQDSPLVSNKKLLHKQITQLLSILSPGDIVQYGLSIKVGRFVLEEI